MSTGRGFPAAVIFDMDGVLIDSEPLWRIAEQEVFGRVGLDLDDAECERTMGRRTDEVVGFWFARSPWNGPSCEQVSQEITDRVTGLVRERGRAKPGAESLVALCEELRLPMAVASSSPTSLIEVVLDRLGLRRAFRVLVSAEDEELGKPDPAVFLTAARRLHVAPESCLVIEDSEAGVRAARGAGMVVVAVPEAHQADAVEFQRADLTLRSLEELGRERLAALTARVASGRGGGLPVGEGSLKLEGDSGSQRPARAGEAGHDPD